MHFFNPVQKMKLVEIVRGLETSEETLAGIEALARPWESRRCSSGSRPAS